MRVASPTCVNAELFYQLRTKCLGSHVSLRNNPFSGLDIETIGLDVLPSAQTVGTTPFIHASAYKQQHHCLYSLFGFTMQDKISFFLCTAHQCSVMNSCKWISRHYMLLQQGGKISFGLHFAFLSDPIFRNSSITSEKLWFAAPPTVISSNQQKSWFIIIGSSQLDGFGTTSFPTLGLLVTPASRLSSFLWCVNQCTVQVQWQPVCCVRAVVFGEILWSVFAALFLTLEHIGAHPSQMPKTVSPS